MNEQAKHTPGPWEEQDGVVVGPNGAVLIYTPFREDYITKDDPEVLANAKLIAAAPELFECLEEFVAIVESCREKEDSLWVADFPTSTGPETYKCWNKIKAALEKVRS